MTSRTHQPSRNVTLCKALKCTQALARGLWNNGVLSPYLFILTNQSKTAVGVVQGMFGLATACLALPAGILSDKTARHYVSKLSAVLDVVAICATSAAVLSSHHKFHLLSIGALFWGLSVACDSNTDALFADSIPAAERSSQFTQLQALSMACLGAGPLIAAIIFHAQGDQWTLHALGIVILCGMVASLIPVMIKLMVHDKYTLGAEAEAVTEFLTVQQEPNQQPPSAQDAAATTEGPQQPKNAVQHAPLKRKTLPVVHSGAELRLEDAIAGEAEHTGNATTDAEAEPPSNGVASDTAMPAAIMTVPKEDPAEARLMRAAMLLNQMDAPHDCGGSQRGFGACCFSLRIKPEWIPVMVFSADVVSGLASGMTIKFFPIFFMDKSHLSPMENSLLAASTPVAIATGIFVAQRLSSAVGRVPTILTFKWMGVLFLLVMAYARSFWSIKAFILPLYLARTASANCTSALARSILMDFVSKKHRGKWSCLDGVTIFGWSGSAVVGGILLDRFGFRSVFVATAAMQFVGSLFTLALLPVVSAFENALKLAVQEEAPSDGMLTPGSNASGAAAAPITVATMAADLEYEACSQNIKSVSSFPEEGALATAASATSPSAASANSSFLGGSRSTRRPSLSPHRVSGESEYFSVCEPLLPSPGNRRMSSEASGEIPPISAGYNRQGSIRLSVDGSEEVETGHSFSTFTGTG